MEKNKIKIMTLLTILVFLSPAIGQACTCSKKMDYSPLKDDNYGLENKNVDTPYVITIDATQFNSISATLNGLIFKDGGEPCQVKFKYKALSEDKWNQTSWKEELYEKDETFSETVNNLMPSTKYIFYAIAKNSAGEVRGEELNFTTFDNQPPGKPKKPSGPEHGSPGEKYDFVCYAPDAEEDEIYFDFLFKGYVESDDGFGKVLKKRRLTMFGPYESNKDVTVEGVRIPDDYILNQQLLIYVRASDHWDYHSKRFGPYSDKTSMHLTLPPENLTIDGPTSVDYGLKSYTYTFSADEPDNENLLYYIDWGDGTNTGWKGSYKSGYELSIDYRWEEKDTYNIRFKAKDIWGVESGWKTLTVSSPKSKNFNSLFFQLFRSDNYIYNLVIQLIEQLVINI